MAADGLITLKSSFGPQETMQRLEAEVKAKGLTVFAKIDHAAGAVAAGMALRPTELLIFGAARGGTPLMQAVQTIGIDLPLKALVWQDAAGATWLSYNDPEWFAKRAWPRPRSASAGSGDVRPAARARRRCDGDLGLKALGRRLIRGLGAVLPRFGAPAISAALFPETSRDL